MPAFGIIQLVYIYEGSELKDCGLAIINSVIRDFFFDKTKPFDFNKYMKFVKGERDANILKEEIYAFDVSSERIREIERKAIRRLRTRGASSAIRAYLNKLTDNEDSKRFYTDRYKNRKEINTIILQKGIEKIPNGAFNGFYGLTSAKILKGVTEIGDGAFINCRGLTSVEIPEGVTSIGKGAFYGCSSLTSVKIPESVTSIGEYAFMGCNIQELNHPCLTIKNALVIEKGKLLYCADSKISKCVIPVGVSEIGQDVFADYSGLTSVEIPEGVTSIGHRAFAFCKGLTSVELPKGMTSIGAGAFAGCKGLTSVEIPDGMETVGEYAFEDCTGLTSVYIPKSVTFIGDYAFRDCLSLTSVKFLASMTSIGNYSFSGCKVKNLTIRADYKNGMA